MKGWQKLCALALVVALVLVSLPQGRSVLVNSFNDSSTSATLTFTGNQNITRFASFYRYGNVTSATLNLSRGDIGNISSALKGYWALNENSGTTAIDSAGLNNGTMSGYANWTTVSKLGASAVSFNQLTSSVGVVLISHNSSISGFPGLSVSAWINTSKEQTATIVGKDYDGFGEWVVEAATNNSGYSRMSFSVRNSSGNLVTLFPNLPDGVNYFDSRWHHIFATYNGSEMDLYFDNVMIGNTSQVGTIKSDTASNLLIGAGWGSIGGFQRRFNGTIDEVGIWNRSLTDYERTRLYAAGAGLQYGNFPDPTLANNSYLEIGTPDGTREWFFNSSFNQTNNKTGDLSSKIRSLMNGSACSGGTISGNNCIIQFLFHSDVSGSIQVSDLNFQWVEYTKPNSTIIQPASTVTSVTPDVIINASDDYALQECHYNITTAGGALQVVNTPISNCASTVSPALIDHGSYIIWVTVNDSSGNVNISSSSFSVSTGSGGGSTAQSGGGGGGPSSGVVVIGNKVNWSLSTENGGDQYDFYMLPGDTREKSLLFLNRGLEKVQLSIDCEGEFCEFVSLETREIELPGGQYRQATEVLINVALPEGVDGDEYSFSIIATDQEGNEGVLPVVIHNSPLGFLSQFWDKTFSSTDVGGVRFPVWPIAGFMTVMSIAIFGYLVKPFPLKGLVATGVTSLVFILTVVLL